MNAVPPAFSASTQSPETALARHADDDKGYVINLQLKDNKKF
jgi:hypothetical protein